MRTIILYASRHHGNTKKLVDAIVEAHPEIDTLDVKTLGKNEYPNLHEYHLIGVATGIYYSEIDKDMARVLTNVLQPQDKVFGLMTYGGKNKWYGKDIDGICRMRQNTREMMKNRVMRDRPIRLARYFSIRKILPVVSSRPFPKGPVRRAPWKRPATSRHSREVAAEGCGGAAGKAQRAASQAARLASNCSMLT